MPLAKDNQGVYLENAFWNLKCVLIDWNLPTPSMLQTFFTLLPSTFYTYKFTPATVVLIKRVVKLPETNCHYKHNYLQLNLYMRLCLSVITSTDELKCISQKESFWKTNFSENLYCTWTFKLLNTIAINLGTKLFWKTIHTFSSKVFIHIYSTYFSVLWWENTLLMSMVV